MIFTSNKNPALWREDFNEDTTLLCALDRIFDDAMVFKLRGESFRGKKLETISLQTGKVKAVESVTEMNGYFECHTGLLVYYKSVSAIAGGGKTAVLLNTFSKGLARCSGSNWVFFPDPNWLCAPGANIGKAGTVLASGAYS